jgi:hypothetical protein
VGFFLFVLGGKGKTQLLVSLDLFFENGRRPYALGRKRTVWNVIIRVNKNISKGRAPNPQILNGRNSHKLQRPTQCAGFRLARNSLSGFRSEQLTLRNSFALNARGSMTKIPDPPPSAFSPFGLVRPNRARRLLFEA